MSASAIFDTTMALMRRLQPAVNGGVHVGPPIRAEMGDKGVALFLFQIEANRELRNITRVAAPIAANPATEPGRSVDAIPVDLRYLIAAFRTVNAGGIGIGDADELLRIGQVIQRLQSEPVLSDAALVGQTVRVTPEPYSMEQLSRLWDVFPGESYRASMVYLASPVFIEADPRRVGPPVELRRIAPGVMFEPELVP